MRKKALIIAIIGITILTSMLELPGKIIEEKSLEEYETNQKIILEGVVKEQKNYGELKILKINNLEIKCNCEKNYEGKNVMIQGIIEEYNQKKQVQALRIKETK